MKLKNLSKVLIDRLLLLVIMAIPILAVSQQTRQIQNPYSSVDWTNHKQYKANLHTHTMVSDGWMNPQTVVRKYNEAGYKILAVTDHWSVTYPWEGFSRFRAGEKVNQRIKYGILKPQEAEPIAADDTVFMDIRPSDIGMAAIQGNELSFAEHHMNSFFNDDNSNNFNTIFDTVREKGGIMVFNHPGRYRYPAKWYSDLCKRFDHMVGIEVFNCGNRYPNDRRLWDSVLTVMAPVRPVWGFSNDDMHSMRDFGRNWNVLILPDLNEQNVRKAMENGIFYFINAPESHDGPQPPVISSIAVNQKKGKITIGASRYKSIVWIYNGKEIKKGRLFRLRNLPGNNTYIRAELYGAGNTVVCTQPFFIK